MLRLLYVHPRDQATTLLLVALLAAVILLTSHSAKNESRHQVKPYRIEVNAASLAELRTLPEIGMRRAEKIYQERRQHGRYATRGEMAHRIGLGSRVWDQLDPYVRMEGKP